MIVDKKGQEYYTHRKNTSKQMQENMLMRERNPIMLEEAQERLKQIDIIEETEIVKTADSLGRICAQDIYAAMDQPPFPRSPLDGYAVRSEDIMGASQQNPVCLNVIEHICAGMYPEKAVGKGEAARIMTGAPIPEGADGVIMQELTDEGEEVVAVYQPTKAYGNYCKMGEDTYRGTLLLRKGTRIRAAHIGILSSQGICSICAFRVPVIGIMATGDELMPVGTSLLPGKIYDSNGPLLAARITEIGLKAMEAGHAGDDTQALAEKVRSRLQGCDALITSGGVSVGVRDCLPYVAETLGAEVLFHGINVKPGSPMMVMLVDQKPVFCLSGNPFAAAATFEVLVRPVLERMRGRSQWKPDMLLGILENPFSKPSPCRRLIRGRIDNGVVWLPDGRHSSGMLSSMAECNCLVDIPAGSDGLNSGDQVRVILM